MTAKMTSLSAQLSRLRVPQTSAQKERRGMVSFLYDFLEAKSIDNDMHYAIAVSGLEALIRLDTSIDRFRETLFSESSKTLDRSVQSREANQDLDTEVEAFLFTVVSKYFLLNSTHKTIEWLIYRYGVNEYNADALIASALPYHETRLFVRLLQTCSQIRVHSSHWFWLNEVQSSGSPLPKTTLITHCISVPSFLRFICENVMKCLKIDDKNNSFITFFTSILINIIDRNTNESIISIIIGSVSKGLKSKNPSLRKACLCICGHICVRIQLEANINRKLLKAMAKRLKSSDIEEELIVCLSVMHRYQHLDDLPFSLIENISCDSLIECNERHDIQGVICLFLRSLLNNCSEAVVSDKLMILLDKLTLNCESINTCIQTMAECMKSDETDKPIETFKKVFNLFELRYPTLLDSCVAKLDSISLIESFLSALKYSFLDKSRIPLIFGLTHISESVQSEAIHYLIQNFDSLVAQKDEMIITTIKSLLSEAFASKSPQLLISIFGLKEKMFEILNEEEMREICQNLLNFCRMKNENCDHNEMSWRYLQNSILATYCSTDAVFSDSDYSFIYPFLLPLNESDFITFAIIVNSKRAKYCQMLSSLRKKHKKLFDEDFNETHLNSILSVVLTHFAEYYIENVNLICEKSFVHINHSYYYLKSCALSLILLERIHVLSSDAQVKQISANILITLIETMLKSMNISKSKRLCQTMDDYLNHLMKNFKRNRFNLSEICFILDSVVDSIDSSIVSNADSWFWFKQLNSMNYLYKLFFLLFNNSYHQNKSKSIIFRKTFIRFIQKIYQMFGYDYFSALWLNDTNLLSQIRSLQVASHLVKTDVKVSEMTVWSAIISMHSPLSICRESALVVAKHLTKTSTNLLLKECLNREELIISDANSVSCVISEYFSSNPKNKSQKQAIESLKSECIAIISDDNTPEHFKSGLVLLLNRCDTQLLQKIIAKLNTYLNLKSPNSSQIKTIECLLSIYSEPNVLQNADTNVIFNFFLNSIQTKFSQEVALNLISRQLFDSLNAKEFKISLLNELLEIFVKSNNKTAKKKLKKLLKSGDLISDLLQSLVPLEESMDSGEPKAKRLFANDSLFSLELNHWKKFIILLEMFQSKSNLSEVSLLIKHLFEYLKKTFIMESKSSLEYLRQLILSSLINCIQQNTDKLPFIPIESVIECLRESQQKETQKITLILISSVAHQFKKEILDYVITIFTFIGTNLLHCDDQYSIQVVSDTMDAIIPILLDDTKDTKHVVINVFIDSLADIPAHRRLHLFGKLLHILGEREHLALIYMKVIERIYNKSKSEKEPFLNLLVALTAQIDVNIQIDSLNHIMDVFINEFTDGTRVLSITDQNLSDNDRRLIAQSLAEIILAIVSSHEFIQLTTNSEWTQISDQLLTFLHSLIVLITKYSNESQFPAKELNAHRRRVRSVLYKILLHFNSLLPKQQLIELVLQLLKNESILIQRKGLELLNEKLAQLSDRSLNSKQLFALLDSLISMVPTPDSVNQMDEQHVYNTQLSMITCKLLSKHFEENTKLEELVKNLIEKIIALINGMESEVSVNFKASCILCLTQLMISLANKAIPIIPAVMPILLNNFDVRDEVIIISNITSISKITQKYPQFLSPYLDQIIVKLLSTHNKCPQIKSKLKSIWDNFAKMIPKRILLSSVDSCFNEVSKISIESLCELMALLKQTFEDISSKGDVQNIQKFVKNLLLKTLDVRNMNRNSAESTQIDSLENSCNETFCALIPKMTEITFRPLFYKLYDWAIREKNGKLFYRMISFYKFLQSLADKLKSLFCVFIAPSIINNCSQMLSLFHSDNQSDLTLDPKATHLLITYILSTLCKCFLYDINGSLLNKERMQTLAKPIINQLTNTIGTDEEYNARVETLCLCTQYMIESNRDDTIIKDFNYQILLKTRETSNEIRLGALRVLHRLILVCGEDYLPIIPETIPFISELSEDDFIPIENLIKTVVMDLEHILGEPITKYL